MLFFTPFYVFLRIDIRKRMCLFSSKVPTPTGISRIPHSRFSSLRMNEQAIKIHDLKPGAAGISIGDLGQALSQQSGKLHRHSYWEIFLVKEGSGRHLVDFEETAFAGNSVHIILPHHVHQLSASSTTKGLVLTISDDFFHASNENRALIPGLGNYQLQHKTPILHFSAEEFNGLWEIALQMQRESLVSSGEKNLVLKNYLSILLCKCRRQLALVNAAPRSLSDLELFISFRHFVETHFQQHTKIQDYLKLLGVNDKKLFAVCSFYTGISPSDYLHRRILTEAKRLLLFSPSCQKEIAYRLNFTDLSHFIKFFKQKTGLLPREFAARSIYGFAEAESLLQ